jgi:hypothetical protein
MSTEVLHLPSGSIRSMPGSPQEAVVIAHEQSTSNCNDAGHYDYSMARLSASGLVWFCVDFAALN